MYAVLLAAYAVIALLGVVVTTVRMAAGRPHRDRYTDRLDNLIVAVTAIVASAAWPLLLPVLAAGWLRSPGGRAKLARLGAGVRLLPSPIFRDRMYGALR